MFYWKERSDMRKIYVKLLLSTGIPFGVFMAIVQTAIQGLGLQHGALLGLASGAVFGGIMALVLGSHHRKSVHKAAPEDDEGKYDDRQSKTVTLSVPYEDAFALCLKSLETVHAPVITHKDYQQGLVTAKSGMTWNSWGNTISYRITAVDENTSSVEVTSRPPKFQIADYGENLRQIQRIVSVLQEAS